jgi:hypothetical protein
MSRAQRLLVAAAVSGWLASASPGQEPAPPAAPPATPREPAQAEREAPPAEKPPGNTEGASEDEFIPTEELQPDAAITFPVDI